MRSTTLAVCRICSMIDELMQGKLVGTGEAPVNSKHQRPVSYILGTAEMQKPPDRLRLGLCSLCGAQTIELVLGKEK